MGFGELLAAVAEILALVKEIQDLLEAIGVDYKDVEKAIDELREMVEGPLMEALHDVGQKLSQACEELIRAFHSICETITKSVQKVEKTDKDGADLLKSALNM